MTADLSMQILVIILSTTLAIFLVLAIVLIVKLIQVANAIKHITTKAEEIVDRAEEVSEMFQRTAAPLAVGRLLSNIADLLSRKGKGDK